MSAFDGIESAKSFSHALKMRPGFEYDLEIVQMQETRSGRDNGLIVPIRFVVLASNDPEREAGTVVSWVPKHSQGHAFLSNMLGFALAVLGLENTEQNQKEMQGADRDDPARRSRVQILLEEAVGEENAFAGEKVRCTTWGTTTKNGHEFVAHSFSPLR